MRILQWIEQDVNTLKLIGGDITLEQNLGMGVILAKQSLLLTSDISSAFSGLMFGARPKNGNKEASCIGMFVNAAAYTGWPYQAYLPRG